MRHFKMHSRATKTVPFTSFCELKLTTVRKYDLWRITARNSIENSVVHSRKEENVIGDFV